MVSTSQEIVNVEYDESTFRRYKISKETDKVAVRHRSELRTGLNDIVER